jgi:hypothetical protein
MEELKRYIPLLIPLLLIQVTMMIIALVDLAKREKTRGPKWVWVLVVIFVNMIGPIIYFVLGREEE